MPEYMYELKSSLITPTERSYLTAIKHALPQGYFVQPQINLASIITKAGDFRFQNELYRNIDACIFDMSYKPIVLIEINDLSHKGRTRRERDEKVKNICEDAGIQLITFWTSYGINQDYISKRINEAIRKAPYIQRISHFSKLTENHNQPPYSSLNENMIDENKYQTIFGNSSQYLPEGTSKRSLKESSYLKSPPVIATIVIIAVFILMVFLAR